nr:MAG TPA: hypothetical protein [Caudoviricetes sp.]
MSNELADNLEAMRFVLCLRRRNSYLLLTDRK